MSYLHIYISATLTILFSSVHVRFSLNTKTRFCDNIILSRENCLSLKFHYYTSLSLSLSANHNKDASENYTTSVVTISSSIISYSGNSNIGFVKQNGLR